ncbi:hypothetical protein OG758_48655 [Streptomyces sp. NBC_01474]|uniref:hypothetical protein n=1 Tax=Streptomyces sp. NBC_01474 TaxID=2903880 RepID=UPI002DDB64AB|nr:hypothetical protein [Streptomyces sp. NBC_01474]WSD92779.1 hypothetical protein OG758_00135 [Streptomyces sp. NBC_01474]WSE01276.1 hypothetical protein OG758_48655 [Streptomyces sp. NBC_01474]
MAPQQVLVDTSLLQVGGDGTGGKVVVREGLGEFVTPTLDPSAPLHELILGCSNFDATDFARDIPSPVRDRLSVGRSGDDPDDRRRRSRNTNGGVLPTQLAVIEFDDRNIGIAERDYAGRRAPVKRAGHVDVHPAGCGSVL